MTANAPLLNQINRFICLRSYQKAFTSCLEYCDKADKCGWRNNKISWYWWSWDWWKDYFCWDAWNQMNVSMITVTVFFFLTITNSCYSVVSWYFWRPLMYGMGMRAAVGGNIKWKWRIHRVTEENMRCSYWILLYAWSVYSRYYTSGMLVVSCLISETMRLIFSGVAVFFVLWAPVMYFKKITVILTLILYGRII